MSENDAWRASGSWEPPERPFRWPPFVGAMVPCGAGAFALGHALHALPMPLRFAGLFAVVLACAAPVIATFLGDALSRRFEELAGMPPRAMGARCAALALGALAAAFVPSVATALSIGAIGYELVAVAQIWRAERQSRSLR